MRRAILAAMVGLLACGGQAWAGGSPPMFVLVEKVVLESENGTPKHIQIWGCFLRTKREHTEDFGPPVYGYMYLQAPEQKEAVEWSYSAGRVVPIGSCLEAGAFLKLPIRKPDQSLGKPDGAHPPGQVGRFGNFYGNGQFDATAPVKELRAFAKRVGKSR